jgi:glutamine cyclotransferase
MTRSLLRLFGPVLLLLAACEPSETAIGEEFWIPQVVERYPHDIGAFTQGLIFTNGKFYESTGRRGASSLRRVDPKTGRVEQITRLPPQLFAEGLTEFDGRLVQLTWQAETGLIYEIESFELTGQFRYEGEGWGLTHDGERLIMSDGTSELRFLDPVSYEVTGSVTVTSQGQPLANLNELEFIDGEVWANIWYDDRIARIDPVSGIVVGWVDLSALYPAATRSSEAVVNGIAYDAATDTIYVTGKLWPAIFVIEIEERH